MPFQFDPTLQRYRNERGYFVSQRAINAAVDQVLNAGAENMRALTASLQAGTISLADWQVGMISQVKLLHLGAAMVGRGGRAQMTPSDWGWTGSRLRQQYAYLREFSNEIATGHTPIDGRLLNRAAMYSEAARGTQRQMMGRVAMSNGREEEKNVLGAADRHCGVCVSCSAQGWVPIGTLPPVGSRSCLSRCKCNMQYRGEAGAVATDQPVAIQQPAEPWFWADDETRVSLNPQIANPSWESTLSPAQKSAIKSYTTGGYRDLNAALREGSALTSEQQALATQLDSVIQSAGRYDKPVTVWRGINTGDVGTPSSHDLFMSDNREELIHNSVADYAEQHFKPGNTLQLGGFQSTSFYVEPALSASVSKNSPGLLFEIRTRSGAMLSKNLSNYDDEAELLLGRNTQYRVVGVVRDAKIEAGDYGTVHKRTIIQLEDVTTQPVSKMTPLALKASTVAPKHRTRWRPQWDRYAEPLKGILWVSRSTMAA